MFVWFDNLFVPYRIQPFRLLLFDLNTRYLSISLKRQTLILSRAIAHSRQSRGALKSL